jgi:hypothetical protein
MKNEARSGRTEMLDIVRPAVVIFYIDRIPL